MEWMTDVLISPNDMSKSKIISTHFANPVFIVIFKNFRGKDFHFAEGVKQYIRYLLIQLDTTPINAINKQFSFIFNEIQRIQEICSSRNVL